MPVSIMSVTIMAVSIMAVNSRCKPPASSDEGLQVDTSVMRSYSKTRRSVTFKSIRNVSNMKEML